MVSRLQLDEFGVLQAARELTALIEGHHFILVGMEHQGRRHDAFDNGRDIDVGARQKEP